MVPAKPRDTIHTFLNDVAVAYHLKNPDEKIKCEQLLVEDHYEVDERYSVEECLGDMFRVLITATSTTIKVNNAPAATVKQDSKQMNVQ